MLQLFVAFAADVAAFVAICCCWLLVAVAIAVSVVAAACRVPFSAFSAVTVERQYEDLEVYSPYLTKYSLPSNCRLDKFLRQLW